MSSLLPDQLAQPSMKYPACESPVGVGAKTPKLGYLRREISGSVGPSFIYFDRIFGA